MLWYYPKLCFFSKKPDPISLIFIVGAFRVNLTWSPEPRPHKHHLDSVAWFGRTKVLLSKNTGDVFVCFPMRGCIRKNNIRPINFQQVAV